MGLSLFHSVYLGFPNCFLCNCITGSTRRQMNTIIGKIFSPSGITDRKSVPSKQFLIYSKSATLTGQPAANRTFAAMTTPGALTTDSPDRKKVITSARLLFRRQMRTEQGAERSRNLPCLFFRFAFKSNIIIFLFMIPLNSRIAFNFAQAFLPRYSLI